MRKLPARASLQTEAQGELFRADTGWFLFMRGAVRSGDIARMGPYASASLLVLKSGADFQSGRVSMPVSDIAQLAGISDRQCYRALSKLEEMGYVRKLGRCGANTYQLREQLVVEAQDGTPVAKAQWDYAPSMSDIQQELREILSASQLGGGPRITIEQLNIQLVQGNGATGVQVVSSGSTGEVPEAIRELARRMRHHG